MYKLIIPPLQSDVNAVLRLSDNTQIPSDPANTDYQEYLKWLSEGNAPEPAEEVTN